MKVLLTIPATSSWYLTIARLLKKHPNFGWTIHNVLAVLITAANETNIPAKFKHSGVSELFNDFTKHIAIAYNYQLHDYSLSPKSLFDRHCDNEFSLAYQCIYPFECRAMKEALYDGLRYFETHHYLAKELTESGKAEWFDCIAISGDTAMFSGHRFVQRQQ